MTIYISTTVDCESTPEVAMQLAPLPKGLTPREKILMEKLRLADMYFKAIQRELGAYPKREGIPQPLWNATQLIKQAFKDINSVK